VHHRGINMQSIHVKFYCTFPSLELTESIHSVFGTIFIKERLINTLKADRRDQLGAPLD